jgi:hypothetical protein
VGPATDGDLTKSRKNATNRRDSLWTAGIPAGSRRAARQVDSVDRVGVEIEPRRSTHGDADLRLRR